MPVSNPLNDPFVQLLMQNQMFKTGRHKALQNMVFEQSYSGVENRIMGISRSYTFTDGLRNRGTYEERRNERSQQRGLYHPHRSIELSSPTAISAGLIDSPSIDGRYTTSGSTTFEGSMEDMESSSPLSSQTFSSSSNIDLTRPRRHICIVIAHPDDEVMFFSPTILQICEWSNMSLPTPPYSFILTGRAMPIIEIYLLCFSNGDAYGLGKQRSKELFASATTLGLSIDHIALIQEETLFPDGLEHSWNLDQIVQRIDSFVIKWDIDIIMTFDQYGISRHPNHISLHHAMSLYSRTLHHRKVLCFALQTTNVLMKYTGLLSLLIYPTASLIMTIYSSMKGSRPNVTGDGKSAYTYPLFTFVANPLDYATKIWPAMRKHKSQLVWFRYLYMFSSMYLFQNSFILIEAGEPTSLQAHKSNIQ